MQKYLEQQELFQPELQGQTEYGTSAVRTLHSHFTAALFYD